VDARIDTGDPKRKPAPKPDLRSMLRPLGAVAVFCASNFPLAFSVAGGDTASALAAGNLVVVNAHFSHPGTAECAAPLSPPRTPDADAGWRVSLLFSRSHHIGQALLAHPLIKAAAFTGSRKGGWRWLKSRARAGAHPLLRRNEQREPGVVAPMRWCSAASHREGLHAS